MEEDFVHQARGIHLEKIARAFFQVFSFCDITIHFRCLQFNSSDVLPLTLLHPAGVRLQLGFGLFQLFDDLFQSKFSGFDFNHHHTE